MCVSGCLNVVYIILLLGSTILLLVGTFTPSWSNNIPAVPLPSEVPGTNDANSAIGDVKATLSKQTGLITCDFNWDTCKAIFDNKPSWEKAVIALMVIALAACMMGLVWSCVVCCACCCKSCLAPPLPIFAGLATLCSLIGVIVYAVKTNTTFADLEKAAKDLGGGDVKGVFGYSLWLCVGACVGLSVTTIVGIVLAKVSKVAPL